nr:ubiquitin carboxyl-terminal hydrolase FAM188A [Ipomoea batatas]
MCGRSLRSQSKPGEEEESSDDKSVDLMNPEKKNVDLEKELSMAEAQQLFLMIFGNEVTKVVLAQWSNQGIRFSSDPETSMGLVQHEGGPCGVLATIQTFVLKYLLFSSDEFHEVTPSMGANIGLERVSIHESVGSDIFGSLSEVEKSRVLARSMAEILFQCGSNRRAVIAFLRILDGNVAESLDGSNDEIIAKALDGLSIETGLDLQKVLCVTECSSLETALPRLEAMLPLYRSRLGAMLFLVSALLSRGMDSVQADRDDPTQPLVTAPFGHASQEIVNLLLSGKAVANVFDGGMDLGGGMFVNGISTPVEVGFLTLLESLNFCKVGQYLKHPKWPIWVVGSESHYTVLFARDTKAQGDSELDGREAQVRRAFDARDQSGGGGFINVDALDQVLTDTKITLPDQKLEQLCSAGYIVWSEFREALLGLDMNHGGLKGSSRLVTGKQHFDLYHFNGIAKSVPSGSSVSSGTNVPVQRPRLTKVRVSVPPEWTPEEYMSDIAITGSSVDIDSRAKDTVGEVPEHKSSQHAPLVDCIRTRWPRATCSWEGDSPSIV